MPAVHGDSNFLRGTRSHSTPFQYLFIEERPPSSVSLAEIGSQPRSRGVRVVQNLGDATRTAAKPSGMVLVEQAADKRLGVGVLEVVRLREQVPAVISQPRRDTM